MNWDDYRYFLAVAKFRTLKLASRHLKVDQATVGRRLTALQDRLGTMLLEKRSNGYFLTAAGLRVLANAEAVEQAMLSIDRAIAGTNERIEGVVKIAMPGALANQWLIGALHPLVQQYPKLEIQFLTGPEVINLSRREADLAVRLVRPKQQDLKTKKIGSLKLGLFCAKSFTRYKDGIDLSELPFIGLFETATSELEKNFLSSLDFEPHYCIRSAAWSSVFAGVQAGLGIGILPTFFAAKDKTLRLIQEDGASTPLWLVVHPEIAESARVRVTIDWLSKTLGKSL